jgi:hypothetical protein
LGPGAWAEAGVARQAVAMAAARRIFMCSPG